MKAPLVLAGLLVAAAVFIAGYVAGSATSDAAESDPPQATEAGAAEASFRLPVAAQKAWFAPVSEYDTDGEPLDDAKFAGLLETLAERLSAETTLEDFEREADLYLWSFLRRIAKPALSEAQIDMTKAFLRELAARHPEHRALINGMRSMAVEHYAEAMDKVPPFSIYASVFPRPKEFDTGGELFADDAIERLISILDALLAMPETLADVESEARLHLSRFAGRLQVGRLNESQTARIVSYLEGLKMRHAEAAEPIDGAIFEVRNLMPGRVAPNIVGTDSEGVEFALEEYRGKIVALYFTGQWCGPCRGEYPYQRFMLDLFEDDPVVLLGVNSDEDLETLRDAKETEGLNYRTWWDGHGENNTEGPIAKAWNVIGWPTIYVLDEEGVVQSVNKRRAEVVTAVNALLDERRRREYEERRNEEANEEAADGQSDNAATG